MAEGFIPLGAFLRGSVAAVTPVPSAPPVASVDPAPLRGADSEAPGTEYVHAATIRELTLMRLAAFEAFERAVRALLATFASDVLGRELELAPADVEALARAAIASCGDEPVTIFLSARDAERVSTTLPVRVDAALAAGDLVVEVRDGALESRLSFRVTASLERAFSEAR